MELLPNNPSSKYRFLLLRARDRERLNWVFEMGSKGQKQGGGFFSSIASSISNFVTAMYKSVNGRLVGSMGSLMAGWDSHVQDPKAVTYQRNRSFTKGEIEAWLIGSRRRE